MRVGLIWVLAVLAGFAPGQAAERTDIFALKIRGLTLGTVTLASQVDARDYALTGVVVNTGLTRLFRRFSYRGATRGAVRGARLLPDRYEEHSDTGRRSSEALLQYKLGVPVLLRYSSSTEAGPDAPDPATQGGTIDPLTAIYVLMRDVPRAQACMLDLMVFDGKRLGRIAMAAVPGFGGIPQCRGVYERLQGFTPKEVSRNTRFDFVLNYSDAGDGMLQVELVVFDSSYGPAAIDRR